ncbi:hypothetical protein MVEN_02562500 [Mycena venus]|uniref:Uncharacterized protein n=1 Tax=Mycena venus TaxID=2733690 RepID=A0A8H6U3L1_9AGAR|nr:hypothetical protein MVEN_02562500 [Mycena venus]
MRIGGKGERKRDERGEGETRTHFGIFAPPALKQEEDVVLGWDSRRERHTFVGEIAGFSLMLTPTQHNLITQVASILRALGGAGAECVCAPSFAGAAHVDPAVPPHPPKEKDRTTSLGSEQEGGLVWSQRREKAAEYREVAARDQKERKCAGVRHTRYGGPVKLCRKNPG